MAAIFRWHGASVMKDIVATQRRNVARAGSYLAADIKESFQATPQMFTKFKRGGVRGSFRRRKLKGGPGFTQHEPSKEGEIPAVQKGHLRRSIISEMDIDREGPLARVGPMSRVRGFEIKYARWLEFGTRKMKARPYMRPAVSRNKQMLARLMTGG